jgi:hypothetical protein
VEKQFLQSSRNFSKPTTRKERILGLAMMGFLNFLKRFRSTTGEKVAREFLHCNSFFFISTQIMKPLWMLSFKARAGKKQRKIAAFESVADRKIILKEIYRKLEKSLWIKRPPEFWYRLRAVLRTKPFAYQ